jgi:hypothetical protein
MPPKYIGGQWFSRVGSIGQREGDRSFVREATVKLAVLARAVPVIAVCAALAACGLTLVGHPVMTLSDVVGTWENPSSTGGGKIIFHADGRFNAIAVNLSDFAGSPQECQSVTGTGKWSFPDSQDASPPPLYDDEVSLVFDTQPCNITLVTTSDTSSSPLQMCPKLETGNSLTCNGLEMTKIS